MKVQIQISKTCEIGVHTIDIPDEEISNRTATGVHEYIDHCVREWVADRTDYHVTP